MRLRLPRLVLTARRLGWLAMAVAVLGVVAGRVGRNLESATAILVALVVSLFALAVGALALRTAVRSNDGVPHSLFGLVFAFVAVVLVLFFLGVQRGGVYSG